MHTDSLVSRFSTLNLVGFLCLLIVYSSAAIASQCDMQPNSNVTQFTIDSLSPISLEHATARIDRKAGKACESKDSATILHLSVANHTSPKHNTLTHRVSACICCNDDPSCRSLAGPSSSQSLESSLSKTQYEFGLSYYASDKSDVNTAQAWFLKAARNGNPRAQEELGMMYFTGKGKMKDFVSAYVWLSIAQMQGEHISAFFPDELVSQMTPEEINRAQQKLSACLAEKLNDCQ